MFPIIWKHLSWLKFYLFKQLAVQASVFTFRIFKMIKKLFVTAVAIVSIALSGICSAEQLKLSKVEKERINKLFTFCTSFNLLDFDTEKFFADTKNHKKLVDMAIRERHIYDFHSVAKCSDSAEDFTGCVPNYQIISYLRIFFGKTISFDNYKSIKDKWLSYDADRKIWIYPFADGEITPSFATDSVSTIDGSKNLKVHGHIFYDVDTQDEKHQQCTGIIRPNPMKNDPKAYAVVSLKCEGAESGGSGEDEDNEEDENEDDEEEDDEE